MNYQDLADLIFPNVKSIEYYEEKYGPRDLPEGAIVTRFAPSPTGFVHLGSLYQVVVAKKIAEQTNGVFFLRIEDTDQKREIENGVSCIIESLNAFGLTPDEGMIDETNEKGKYGPYKQSLRKEIYHAYAKRLIEQGKAYPCFASPDELEEMRSKQESAKIIPGYYGVWAKYRNLPIEEAFERIKNGDSYVIRLKSPGREDRKIKVHDIIKGNVEFPENYQDTVIIKADGLPPYHFAHAVDDHLMRTTHVIRGDEWLSSVPLHVQLFQVLGFRPVKYAHIAPIMKEEAGGKRKLSKRKDPEAAVSYYTGVGIPKEAIIEYLLNIANSSFEGWKKANPDLSIDKFDLQLSKMSVSGALFDMNKILDISKNIISKYSAEEIYEAGYNWAKEYDNELLCLLENRDYSINVLGIERNNSSKPRKDISKWSDIKNSIIYMYNKPEVYEYGKINDKEEIKSILNNYIEKIYDENDEKQVWFDKIKDLSEELGYAREVKEWKKEPERWPNGHVGDVSTVLRVALTGRQNTPDLFEIMHVLGKEEMKNRFIEAIKNF